MTGALGAMGSETLTLSDPPLAGAVSSCWITCVVITSNLLIN